MKQQDTFPKTLQGRGEEETRSYTGSLQQGTQAGAVTMHELKIQRGPEQKSKLETQASSPQLFPKEKEMKGFIAPSKATQWFRAVRNPSSDQQRRGNLAGMQPGTMVTISHACPHRNTSPDCKPSRAGRRQLACSTKPHAEKQG